MNTKLLTIAPLSPSEPPAEVVAALERARPRLHYTGPTAIYYAVWLWSTDYCGVWGDGPNGSYEWFIWHGREKKLETSDCGYGSSHWALRDVLNRVDPPDSDRNREPQRVVEQK